MAYKNFKNSGGTVSVDLGDLNPKQKLFCQARTRYVAYGGARGGGKTHVLRVKAFGGALTYPGIRILIVRREYPELEQNIILPMRKMIPAELATYNGSMRMMFFANGSTIKFGHYGPGTMWSTRAWNLTGFSWRRLPSSRKPSSAPWAPACAAPQSCRGGCT